MVLQSCVGRRDSAELALLDGARLPRAVEPLFVRGALFDLRERPIAADRDCRLLERSRELACQTKAFDLKQLPKMVRVAMDVRLIDGAGRMRDDPRRIGMQNRRAVVAVRSIGRGRHLAHA